MSSNKSAKSTKSTKSTKSKTSRRATEFPDNPNSFDFDNTSFPTHQFSQTHFPNQFQQMQNFANTNPSMSFPNNPFNQFSQPQFSQQPFSQYSTRPTQHINYQDRFGYEPARFDEIPHDTDDEEEAVEVTPVSARSRIQIFTQQEDTILAKAYVRISENPMFGTDQKFAVFWDKIHQEYNEMAREAGVKDRLKKSLLNRFGRMKAEMTTYNAAVHFVDSHHHTGINENDRMNLVNDKFKESNHKYKNRPFSFSHVVEILNSSSKFNFTTTRWSLPRDEGSDSSPDVDESKTSGGNSSGRNTSGTDPRSGDKRSRTSSQDGSSPTRPMGSKAAKNAEKLRKGKGKSIDEGSAREDWYETTTTYRKETLEHKREVYRQRQQAVKENLEMQGRMLALKEKQMEIEAEKCRNERDKIETDRDISIMSMDPDAQRSEEARENLIQLKMQIMAKWAAQGRSF